MKTAIIYCCFLYSDWVPIVKQQLDQLFESSYYKFGGEIHILASGLDKDLLLLKLLCGKRERLKIIYQNNVTLPVEAHGFAYMYDMCFNYDFIGFVHSKGVTKSRTEAIKCWRKCMGYFVIDEAENAIKKLSEKKHNCYGVMFDVLGKINDECLTKDVINSYRQFIFPGNFFWINCKWFLSKEKPPMTKDRFFYERYLGYYDDVAPYYPFVKKYESTGAPLTYHVPTLEEEYLNPEVRKCAGYCP